MSARAGSKRPPRPAARRRRLASIVAVAAVAALGAVTLGPVFDKAVREFTLPLRHEDVIRQQAREKRIDPALIAAVIYAETKFRPRRSSAGAEGLMQILPATARFIAERSGGTAFNEGDLADPQVNISYGSYYLRYLLDRYGDNEALALAAYNGGETNLDRWIVEHSRRERSLQVSDIPFPETRAYVATVLDAREKYREERREELGL